MLANLFPARPAHVSRGQLAPCSRARARNNASALALAVADGDNHFSSLCRRRSAVRWRAAASGLNRWRARRRSKFRTIHRSTAVRSRMAGLAAATYTANLRYTGWSRPAWWPARVCHSSVCPRWKGGCLNLSTLGLIAPAGDDLPSGQICPDGEFGRWRHRQIGVNWRRGSDNIGAKWTPRFGNILVTVTRKLAVAAARCCSQRNRVAPGPGDILLVQVRFRPAPLSGTGWHQQPVGPVWTRRLSASQPQLRRQLAPRFS